MMMMRCKGSFMNSRQISCNNSYFIDVAPTQSSCQNKNHLLFKSLWRNIYLKDWLKHTYEISQMIWIRIF
jgi:hypothetical protein